MTAQVMVFVLVMEAVFVTILGQVLIVQLLPAQTTAQVMVNVAKEAVLVMMDGQVMIVQLLDLLRLPVQTTAQIMVTVMRMEAVFVTLDGQVMIAQFPLPNPRQIHRPIYKVPQTQINKH